MKREVEIIQQWQYLGKVHPKLLEDKVFEDCKKAGITSLQSYLYWAEIEKEPGRIDFSSYDILVEKLKKHNLKWVPFLILGPNYATPKWFQKSKESIYAKCLEHQKESKIQSIWNPNLAKYVDRFLKIVAEHYKDKNIFESILLGISGNWGEALYLTTGGFYANFHTHLGFWCADVYAKKNYLKAKGKNFPALEKKLGRTMSWLVKIVSKLPSFLKISLKLILKINKRKFWLLQDTEYRPKNIERAENKKEWLGFVNWYLSSMTSWAEFWLKTARKYFPDTQIYLVTGGTGHPAMGADFSKQCKIAAKYGAGVRITNQTNDYAQSFILTRLVASACRFYKTYFVTEEAAVLQNPEGVIMRIFDAITSGAQGVYCKNFISIGDDPCIKKSLPIGKATEGLENLKENLKYFTGEKPIIKTAVFFPSSCIVFRPEILCAFYNQCARLRDILDFDLIDENMIKDEALDKYQYLLILEGEIPEGIVLKKIPEWKSKGGKLIKSPQENDFKIIKEKIGDIDNEFDEVYATRFRDKVLYYNSNNKKIKKEIPFLKRSIEIEPNSTIEVKI